MAFQLYVFSLLVDDAFNRLILPPLSFIKRGLHDTVSQIIF